ncbi:MAG: hypothetical protein ACOYB8_08540 [Eubacteriaceae bacterium]|jgi:hypothetical protein
MDEARASWNTLYHSKEGFECQITIRDDDETSVAERAKKLMLSLIKSGAIPLKRWKNNDLNNSKVKEETNHKKPEKTYIDAKGVRRCNIRLKNGELCGYPVTERQGRYGFFWSCPNYRDHAV